MKKSAIVYSIVKSVIDSPHMSVYDIILILIDQIEINGCLIFLSVRRKLSRCTFMEKPYISVKHLAVEF